jgi:hypothetical protein
LVAFTYNQKQSKHAKPSNQNTSKQTKGIELMSITNQYGQHQNACVFTIPIVLQIPIQLQPEVSTAPTTCVMPNDYQKQPLPAVPVSQPAY